MTMLMMMMMTMMSVRDRKPHHQQVLKRGRDQWMKNEANVEKHDKYEVQEVNGPSGP